MLLSTKEISYAAGCNRINVARVGLAGRSTYMHFMKSNEDRQNE
jgi:hypothetical protein